MLVIVYLLPVPEQSPPQKSAMSQLELLAPARASHNIIMIERLRRDGCVPQVEQ